MIFYFYLCYNNEHLVSISTITTANGFSSGQWGYLPSQYYNTTTGETIDNTISTTNGNLNFLPAPDNTGDILSITNTANTGTASTNPDTLSTMQEFNTMSADKKGKVVASMVVGQRYQLTDTRDSEQYYVAKLGDGNVWMLDNLRLGGNSPISLTPENTNSFS